MKKLVVSAALLSVLAVQPALAQEEKVSVGQRGSQNVTIGLAANSASLGYWHKVTANTTLGTDLTFIYRDHSHTDSKSYALTPGIKYYLIPEKVVSPYLYGALTGRYTRSGNEDNTSRSRTESFTAGVQGGIGLEWFPIQNLSIAGHVGVLAQYEKAHSAYSSSFPTSIGPVSNGSTSNDEGFSVSTLSSGILLNLYF